MTQKEAEDYYNSLLDKDGYMKSFDCEQKFYTRRAGLDAPEDAPEVLHAPEVHSQDPQKHPLPQGVRQLHPLWDPPTH